MDERVMNAIIEDAVIDIGERGFLTAWLALDYGGSGQSFGGIVLYLPKSWTHHNMSSGFAGHFIYRVLEIAGVAKWSELKGKTIRAKTSHSKVRAIGHIVKEDWFCPSADFMEDKLERPRNCPTCDSPNPNLHPAIQHEGEVQPCRDDWHVGGMFQPTNPVSEDMAK